MDCLDRHPTRRMAWGMKTETLKKQAPREYHTMPAPRSAKESQAHSEAFERMVGAARINDPKLSTREGFGR